MFCPRGNLPNILDLIYCFFTDSFNFSIHSRIQFYFVDLDFSFKWIKLPALSSSFRVIFQASCHSNLISIIFSHTAERMCLLVKTLEASMITGVGGIWRRGPQFHTHPRDQAILTSTCKPMKQVSLGLSGN